MLEKDDWAVKLFAKYTNHMSRIGKTLIKLPENVTCVVNDGILTVEGPKGKLSRELSAQIKIDTVEAETGNSIKVDALDPANNGAIWGTTRALVANMVKGVSDGWSRVLELNGVGFRMEVKGTKLVMRLGFSHEVEYDLPVGITATVEGNVLTIVGIDKQLVGQVASEIRSLKKPEPYKGKGFKYQEETIRRKAGKSAKGE